MKGEQLGTKMGRQVRLCGAFLIGMLLNGSIQASEHAEAIAAAEAVMHKFMETFNARDESAWADTLLFPHVRVASGSVIVSPDKQSFVAGMDFEQFALDNNWDFSQWDSMEVIQAGPTKVHFKVTFSRFNPQGEAYATFASLYVVQQVDGRWGVRARSSFAP